MQLDPMFETDQFRKGLSVRREVLGPEYVDRSLAGVFLQTCIYCGVPAALESFRNAVEVFKEEDAKARAGND